jgi:hypothetical protein
VSILTASASVSCVWSTPWMFPTLIILGGIITWVHNSRRRVDMALPVWSPFYPGQLVLQQSQC